MGADGPLTEMFAQVVDLCAELEGARVTERVRRRIARAYERSMEKALTFVTEDMLAPNAKINNTLRRHCERGAREFLP